jgi:hypothetical protein
MYVGDRRTRQWYRWLPTTTGRLPILRHPCALRRRTTQPAVTGPRELGTPESPYLRRLPQRLGHVVVGKTDAPVPGTCR